MEHPEPPPLSSRPPVVWTDFDQHLIQAVLDFVNTEGTPFKDTQGEHFWPFTGDLWVEARPEEGEQLFGIVWTRPGPWFVPPGALGFSVKGDGPVSSNVDDLTLDRPQLSPDVEDTYWHSSERISFALDDIVNGGRWKQSFQDFLEQALIDGMTMRPDFIDGVLVYRFAITSAGAGWALGLLMLRDSDYLLRECRECHKLFAIFDPKTRSRRYCLDCADDVEREKRNERQVRYRKSLRLVQMIEDGQKPRAACAALGLDVAVLTLPKVVEAIAKSKRSKK